MDGEIWDEERWEAFLEENDRRVEHYMLILFRFMSENPPPGADSDADRQGWERELREYLLSNGLSPDEALPRALSGTWNDDEDEQAEDIEQPILQAEPSDDALGDVNRIPVYLNAQRIASRALKWSNRLPGRVKDSTLVQFCSHVVQIPSNLAKGHGIGYEMEMLGGNIACAKRALASANAALDLLLEMKSASYMERDLYRSFYEDCYEVRNQIGIYVQELRGRFNLGVD